MTDAIKLKLALLKTRRYPKIQQYKTDIKLSPEEYGLNANKSDYDYGTPNLSRNEDITLVVSSSSTKETLLLRIKWRPDSQNKNLVTQVSQLQFITQDQSVYRYDQIETYHAVESKVRSGRVTQYGSNGSPLRLIIASPYRRMRILFLGQMKLVGSSDESIFVKMSVVVNPTSKIFEFDSQFDANCFKLSYDKFNIKQKGYVAAINDLLYQDRHEQSIRVTGEIMIDSNPKIKSTFLLWGFYARHFDAQSSETETKRILAHLDNGQMWHIGLNKHQNESIDFGYSCLGILAVTKPIQKPTEVNWDKIGQEDTKEFSVTLHSEDKTFEYHAKPRQSNNHFYDVTMDTKKGWAWVDLDGNGRDSEELLEKIKTNRQEFLQALEDGLVCKLTATSTSENTLYNKPLVVGINEFDCTCSDLVGSKASSLAQLRLFGSNKKIEMTDYLVPQAFAVTRYAHDLIIQSSAKLREAICKLTETSRNDSQLPNLKNECEFIQKLVSEIKLPAEICQALASKLSAEYGSDPIDQVPFAVRSSSWGEDEEGMSAAGQLDTLLGVKGLESIYNAVMKCFASKFSYENIEYKRQHGLPLDLPMAVVVQEMVECEKAGVMFTCDPTNGNNSMIVITANYGLGESVVSGQSDPDSIRVKSTQSGELKIQEVKVGEKKIIIDSQSMTNEQGTSGQSNYDRSKCCLPDDEILRLASCGRKLERYFQGPRDIEWGFMDGQMYLFQSRPVTGLDGYTDEELIHEYDIASRAEIDFFSRANIGEVMPFAIRPLSLTYTTHMWNVFGANFNRRTSDNAFNIPPSVSSVVQYECYHSFFSMRCNPFLCVSRSGEEKSVMAKAMEISFFGHEMDDQPDLIEASKFFDPLPNSFEGYRYKIRSWPIRQFTMYKITKERKATKSTRTLLRSQKLLGKSYDSNKLLGLYEQLAQVSSNIYQVWENHLFVIGIGSESSIFLSGMLSKYIHNPTKLFSAVAKFLGASPDVLSAEIPQRISDMAKYIKDKGDAEEFVKMSSQKAIEYINKEDKLREDYGTFMSKFGHRCYNEFEIHNKAWRESPEEIVEMLKANCAKVEAADEAVSSTAKLGLHNKPTNEEILDSIEFDKPLESKDRTVLLKYIVPRCQLLVAAREQTKDILVDFTDLQREACRMLAVEMRRQMRIPDDDLLYYLYYDELEPLTRDYYPALVLQAMRRRNMFKKHFSVPWKFDEIIPGARIVPNHLKPSQELDEKLANAPKLYGTPASSGRVQGKVCLVDGYKELDKIRPGNILLTHSTDIGFSPIFPMISGIITEVGGLISHGAVVAREYGLPGLLGIADVTRILKDGEEIILDADNGVIIRLSLTGDQNNVNN